MPGLGADHRLLEPQRAAFPQLVVPPWIPPRKNESLPHYAARMAETVAPSRDVPLILGGVSFGGMLAYEMARYLKPDAVVLIASCRTREGLRSELRAGAWAAAVDSGAGVERGQAAFRAGGANHASEVGRQTQELLVTMFKESDSRFMHWVLQAILTWEPTPLEGVPVFQIHGGRDLMIPARRVQPDEMIPDGGHMINVTHAEQVNSFLAKAASGL